MQLHLEKNFSFIVRSRIVSLVPIVKGVASKSSHNNMNDTIILQIWRLYEAGLRQIPYLDNKFHYRKCHSSPKIGITQNFFIS